MVARRLLALTALVCIGGANSTLALADTAASPGSTPTVTLSVDSGTPGTPVILTGTGFPSGEVIALYIDSPTVYLDAPGPKADTQGGFRESFNWPGKGWDPSGRVDPGAAGTHQVCGDTALPNTTQPVQAKACAPFLVPNQVAPRQSFPQGALLSIVVFGILIVGAVAYVLRTRGAT